MCPHDKLGGDLDRIYFSNQTNETNLYHYTTLDNCLKILEPKVMCLWSINYRYLNDKTEIQYGFSILESKLHHSLSNRYSDSMVKWLMNSVENATLRGYQPYVTSFCSNYESKALWNKYGDSGKGVTIGFKKGFFDENTTDNPSDSVCMVPVAYCCEEQHSKIEQGIKRLNVELNTTSDNNVDQIESIMITYVSSTLLLLTTFKDKIWKSESEVRAVHAHMITPNGFYVPELATRKVVAVRDALALMNFNVEDIEVIYIGKDVDKLAEEKINKVLQNKGDHNIRIQRIS